MVQLKDEPIRRLTMKPEVKKAALYTRVSSNGQNPKMQESELVEYVRRRGWVVYKVYTDKGISGAKQRRPALDSLLNDCRRGRVNVLVVYKFDRFARSPMLTLSPSIASKSPE
jgi:DNA invertase Pin-like site-specific DNA recombinase